VLGVRREGVEKRRRRREGEGEGEKTELRE